MRKDKYKIQVGDVLYSKHYTKTGWEPLKITIDEIFIEAYVGGPVTVAKVTETNSHGYSFKSERYIGDLNYYWETLDECKEALKAKLEYNHNPLT